MESLFKVIVNYRYNQGHYRKIGYWFSNDAEYQKFLEKEYSDEKIRKIVSLDKIERNETLH